MRIAPIMKLMIHIYCISEYYHRDFQMRLPQIKETQSSNGTCARAAVLTLGQRVIKQQKEWVICINEHLLVQQERREDPNGLRREVQVQTFSGGERQNKEI